MMKPCSPSSSASFLLYLRSGKRQRREHGLTRRPQLGNLFVAALAEITGDFAQAIKLSSQVLATRGHIYPADDHQRDALRAYGRWLDRPRARPTSRPVIRRICELTLEPAGAEPLPRRWSRLRGQTLITLGPGSLYTSLITNLLVKGIPEALTATRGLRVFICNLMTPSRMRVWD